MKTSQLIAGIALFIAASATYAQVTPATLGDPEAEKYFIKFIEFPDTQGDAKVRLDCNALVNKKGKLEAGCYVRNNWEPEFANAVRNASKKGVMVPAVDGKKSVKVVLQFQVEFEKVGEEKTIDIILNSGIPENVEEYGKHHVAAQRVYGYEPWMKACPKRADWLINARAHVNDQGEASSVSVEHLRGLIPTSTCLAAIVDTIEGSHFSPTMADGIAVPSSYVEPFGN